MDKAYQQQFPIFIKNHAAYVGCGAYLVATVEAPGTDRAAQRRIQWQLRRGRVTITPSKPAVAGVDSRRTGAYAAARVFVSEY